MSNLIPKSPIEVTKTWLRSVLLQSESALGQVEVKTLTPVQDVNGYLSSVFTAEVEVSKGSDKVDHHKLFIKIMPTAEASRCLIEMNKLDRTEIQAYKVLIPELAKFELTHFSSSLLQKLTPRLFAGKFDLSPESRGFFMVLEDVSLDFQARNFNSGLTKNEVITALTNLAEFHAIAHAFAKTGKINLKETFPFLSNFMDMDKSVLQNTLNTHSLPVFLKTLQGLPDCDELTEVATKRLKNLCHNYVKYVAAEEDISTFLMHGDAHVNNFMFSPSTKECKLVDWQLVTTGPVIIDFGLLAFLSMDPGDTEANLDTFIQVYYNAFQRQLNQVQLDMPWTTLERFKQRVEESAFFATLCWGLLAISLVEKHPSFGPRIHWVLKKCLQHCPEKLS